MADSRKEPEKWIQNIRRTERVHKDRRDETMRYKKAYGGDFSYVKSENVGKYTVKVNFIYYFVETIIPSIFGGEPKIRVKPKRDPGLTAAAQLAEYNTNYWAKELDLKDELKDCLFDSFFGPAAFYTGWEYETEMQEVPDEENPGETKEVEFIKRDRPFGRWLDFWEEVRIDPDVKKTRRARWMAVRITVPMDEFYSTATIKSKFRSGDRKIKPTQRPEDSKPDKFHGGGSDNKSDAEWITYWEVWDREKMERKLVHESVQDEFLNADLSWPYQMELKDDPFPVTILHAKPDPFSNMSFSEFLPVEDQIWERVRHRSVQAAIIRRYAPKYLYNKAAATKEQMKKFLTSDIMSGNEVNNPALINLAPAPQIPNDFWQWDGALRDDLGNISGLVEFEAQSAANTATEASIAEGRSKVRKDARSDAFEEFVATVLGKILMLCQQLQNREVTMRIDGLELTQSPAGPDGTPAVDKVFKISKKDIQGEFDLDIIPGSMQFDNEELEIQHLQRFYELSLNDPEANHRYLIEQMCIKLGIDPKLALLNDQQKQQRAQGQQQAAQAQEQAALQGKIALEREKKKPGFADIQMDAISNPVDRLRIVEAAKGEAGISNLSPGPGQAAAEQVAALNQMQGPGPNMPRTIMPMNASRNLAGNPNPSAPVHPESLKPTR